MLRWSRNSLVKWSNRFSKHKNKWHSSLRNKSLQKSHKACKVILWQSMRIVDSKTSKATESYELTITIISCNQLRTLKNNSNMPPLQCLKIEKIPPQSCLYKLSSRTQPVGLSLTISTPSKFQENEPCMIEHEGQFLLKPSKPIWWSRSPSLSTFRSSMKSNLI